MTGPVSLDRMRIEWPELPDSVRDAVTARTGAVASATPVAAGTASLVALRLRTSAGRQLFLKGVRADEERAVWMCRNEQRLGPLLPGVAPPVLWLVEVDGWVILGTEWVPGRAADIAPGSPDLPLVAAAVQRVAELGTPRPGRWLPLAKRWDLPGPALDGDTVVHTDLCADNLLITGDEARIIDWAWPARGPAWADTAMLIARLIRAGHTPADAEAWAATVPAWRDADLDDVTAFTTGRAEFMAKRADPRPEIEALTAATIAWRDYRTGGAA